MPHKKSKLNTERFRGHRVKLYPTEIQKSQFDRNIEIARATYNIALGIQIDNYKSGMPYIGLYDMENTFTILKTTEKYKWLNDASSYTIYRALADLDNAFQRFFKKVSGFPNFKSKKKAKKAYAVRPDRTHIKDSMIKISGIDLKDKYVEAKDHKINPDRPMYHPVISFDGYNYWFSCSQEKDLVNMQSIEKTEPIGIDVGIRNMITTSNGEVYQLSDTSKLEKRLKHQQRKLDKDYRKYYSESIRTKTKYEDVPKSKNHYKRLKKQRSIYDKIRNKRKNDLNTATKRIVDQNPSAIVIETISVREIHEKEPWMNKYSPQLLFNEIHRQIIYKAADRSIPVIKADRNYPSTRKCSKCGYIDNNIGSKHVYRCPECGLEIDRDLNAALNLKALAYQDDNPIVYSIEC